MRGAKTKLILERYRDVTDGMGGYTRTWDRTLEISGVFFGLSTNERTLYEKMTVESTHRFIYKSIKGVTVTEKDRFRLGSRVFEIKSAGVEDIRANWDVVDLKEYTT